MWCVKFFQEIISLGLNNEPCGRLRWHFHGRSGPQRILSALLCLEHTQVCKRNIWEIYTFWPYSEIFKPHKLEQCSGGK